MVKTGIPEWLADCCRIALLGEVYKEIRAIAIDYDSNGHTKLRYYLDREPTDFDLESIDVVAINLDAVAPQGSFRRLDVECLFSNDLSKDVASLSGFLYFRREY